MKFVFVPRGSFRMGYPNGVYGESTIHKVTVSGFWMEQYEVTNAQFKLFKTQKLIPKFAGPTQPVTPVTWNEARDFCRWLSKREGRNYRLPTEAEWEYAARGGLDQKEFPWGNENPDGRANWGNHVTLPVGSFSPNAFGLYDMAGNVEEYVNDYFGENYYKISPELNPPGPKRTDSVMIKRAGTDWRIARGGSYAVLDLQCGKRSPIPLNERNPMGCGFRVVLSPLYPNSDKAAKR